jgi:hypothetical protein
MDTILSAYQKRTPKKISELSGIQILRRKKQVESNKNIFVPFKTLLVLNEWEKDFNEAAKKGLRPA